MRSRNSNTQRSFLPSVLAASIAYTASPQLVLAQGVLEEVIVTAQKREQSLQDVPIAVSAFSGQMLQAVVSHLQQYSQIPVQAQEEG